MTVPDGKPIVWALRSLGEEIEQRVYGPDLMLEGVRAVAGDGGVALPLRGTRRGGDAGAGGVAAGAVPGPADRGELDAAVSRADGRGAAEVAERIDGSGADIVWVGIGSPRQELWMQRMRPVLRAPVLVGVGAAFDFHAGLVSQAPKWMGDRGLEWLYRLSREPRRLAPRYLRDNPGFIAAFARQWARERRR